MRSSVANAEVIASTAPGAIRVLWLAEVEIAGITFRACSEEVDVVDADGSSWRYEAGLMDLVHQMGVEGLPSISLTLGPGVAAEFGGWPALLGRQRIPRPPHGGRARLIRWVYGQVYDAARVWFDGVISDCQHGGSNGAISVAVDRATSGVKRFPPERAAIDQRTWPSSAAYQVDEEILGAVYPVVIGKPGGSASWGLSVLDAHSSPAYLADYAGGAAGGYASSKLLFSWVPDGTTLVDTTVSVMDVSGGSAAPGGMDGAWTIVPGMTVSYTTDLLGQTVAYVSPTGFDGWGATIAFRPGGIYFVKMTLGGVRNTDRTGPLRKCGEYIGWLLGQCGVPVDQGRMQAARGRLDRYMLDFVHTESIDGEQFIATEIGKNIPLVRRSSANGVWYELLRYDASPEDATLHLVAHEGDPLAWGYVEVEEDDLAAQVHVTREGDVAWVPDLDKIVNEYVVRYRITRGKEPTMRVEVTGGKPVDLGVYSASICGSTLCAVSRSLYDVRNGDPIVLKLVHDTATATQIALDRALRFAIPRRVLTYVGGVTELETVEPGDVVRVTDREMGVDRSLGLVMHMTVGLDLVVLRVELLDHLQLIGQTE